MIRLQVSVTDGSVRVAVQGSLLRDHGCELVSEVVAWLCEFGERRIALDMRAVPAVDAEGLASILDSLTTVRRSGGVLTVQAPSDRLMTVMRQTGLDGVLDIRPRPRGRHRPAVHGSIREPCVPQEDV